MDIFIKIIRFILTAIVDIVVLSGLAVVLAWAIWDITPQTSIKNTAYFCSESWHIITGQPRRTGALPSTTPQQLKPSEKRTQRLYK